MITFNKNSRDYKPYSKAKKDDIVKYVNFEDIFHVLELLSGFTLQPFEKKYMSAYKVFATLKAKYANVDRQSIISSLYKIIDLINEVIAEYSNSFEEKSSYFCDFFRCLEKDYILNIFNLNYDTWCEQSLKSYSDGFKPVSGYDSFLRFSMGDYKMNYNKSRNTIAHLHGSILFGPHDLKQSDINRFAYIDDKDCLYKYKNYLLSSDIRKRVYRSSSNNQAGENIMPSNIITGLMKTDKILCNPLMEYEHHFYHALTTNKNLLIVGYGFNDKYINSMLMRYQSAHYEKRKVMLITKADEKKDWQPQITPPLSPDELTKYTMLMFKNQAWYKGVNFVQVDNGYFSDDNMASIYTCGLKSVANKHMEELLSFFKA